MKLDKERIENQALFQHALYFDPINQPQIPGGDGRFKPGMFTDLPGVRTLENGDVEVTYYAPDAKKVEIVGLGGSMAGTYELKPAQQEGYWITQIDDIGPGFHYHIYRVDGVLAMHPQVPVGYGCSMAYNFFEVPSPNEDFYFLKDVPHGAIHMEIYKSSVSGRWRNCWVYTPPGYTENSDKRYPVLYIQHGGGENETGWIWQGKINYIMDNLLADKACEEMIVVMNCGYNFKKHENGQYSLENIGDVICKDCIPVIDSRYRTRADRKSRAMAGLSFGSFHAKTTVFDNIDMFANLGLFSGGFDYKTDKNAKFLWYEYDYSEIFKDADTFNSHMDLLFVGAGQQEQPMCDNAQKDVLKLKDKGYNAVFYSCPGYHEWDVWRRCANAMLPLLFKA